ncbi:hypothetical protein EWB00_003194 [Schistosoma japonicum]|uniref:Hypotheticial protein n=1 Tax=Schistosoma japonicum TaxID=6182 RepID=C1LD77_SCHJA|nr:hypothetical protein EWB00_003194 [Schistosoma japonicum]CAX72655.1 hypotheticial protein [Schistosoma japonicum]
MSSIKESNNNVVHKGCNQQFGICTTNTSMMGTNVMHNLHYNNMKDNFNDNSIERLSNYQSLINDITNRIETLKMTPSYFCLDYDDEVYFSVVDYNLDD